MPVTLDLQTISPTPMTIWTTGLLQPQWTLTIPIGMFHLRRTLMRAQLHTRIGLQPRAGTHAGMGVHGRMGLCAKTGLHARARLFARI